MIPSVLPASLTKLELALDMSVAALKPDEAGQAGSARKRQRSASPVPPPNNPLPAPPATHGSGRTRAAHPMPRPQLHTSTSSPALRRVAAPSTAPPLPTSQAFPVFGELSQASPTDPMRRAKSYTVFQPDAGPSTLSLASQATQQPDQLELPSPVDARGRKASIFGRMTGSSKGKEKELPEEPPERPTMKRKATFGFLRRLDTRSSLSPTPSPTATFSASELSLPITPGLDSPDSELSIPKLPELAPMLPEVDSGKQLSISFDPSSYMPASLHPAKLAPPLPLGMERSFSESTARTPVMTRPRSSTAGSKGSAPTSILRAAIRRSNSVSSVQSSKPPSLPPKNSPLAASSTSVLPTTPPAELPPVVRRPSTASSMFSGILKMGRRRSSVSLTQALSPMLSSSPSGQFVQEPEEELLASVPEASTSQQLLEPPVVHRRESSSSLSSSAQTSEATTDATSQLAELSLSKSALPATRSRSSSQLRSALSSSVSKQSLKPEQDESPEHYLARLREICSPTEIARVLASSSDPANVAALEAYISSFEFAHLPIDVAVRRLLMELFLPTETQQIDRVMEAFAKRYHEQNPQLFTSTDQPYLLAFAMIMLHTDAFNTANKNKMTKAAFVKNTRSEGVPSILLEYIFDNICFSPFIFVDEVDVNGQRSLASDSSTFLPGKSKVDPYHMISTGLTRKLRAEVDLHIPTKNPFSFTGTVPFFNSSSLHRAFADAPLLRVFLPPKPPPSSPTLSKTEVLIPGATMEDAVELPTSPTTENMSSFRVSKVGLLHRKDFVADKGKKGAASRKWREWSVILTGSQLLFFRDPIWGLDLSNQILRSGDVGQLKSPRDMLFRPDGVLSLQDSIAVFDWTFTERANSFTLIVGGTRLYQLQAPDAAEMNDWIATINYAASFKTAGVRMRGSSANVLASSMSSAFLAETAIKASLTSSSIATLATTGGGGQAEADLPLSPVIRTPDSAPMPQPAPEWDDDHVFEQFSSSDLRYRPDAVTKSVLATRSDIIRNKIVALETTIGKDKRALQADLRLARNLAVLTPFKTSTRERIQEAVVPLAKRVRHTRLSLCKNVLMREVLARDLLAEEREAQRARQVSQPDAASMSATDDDVALVRKGSRARRSNTDATPLSTLAADQYSHLRVSTPSLEVPSTPDSPFPPPHSASEGGHSSQHAVEDESAVDWDDTKAGKRVSLVQIDLQELPNRRPTLDAVDEGADNVV